MKLICAVDIGNSTTEVSIAKVYENKEVKFLSSSRVKTTGLKGTKDNIIGIIQAINKACEKLEISIVNIDLIKINEAAPVIGENSMETITETIITNSAMIGHNPDTPGGNGLAFGETIMLKNYSLMDKCKDYIVIVSSDYTFKEAANLINNLLENKIKITGAIVKEDEGVLIHNRLIKKIPIIDEVKFIEKIPLGKLAAIEVADIGKTLTELSNPFKIANLFDLNPYETEKIIPLAKGLIGLRSGVIIKTPEGDVKEKKIKVGKLTLLGNKEEKVVDVNLGAEEIMKAVNNIKEINDVFGEEETNVSFVINNIKDKMCKISKIPIEDIKVKDIFAVDTLVSKKIKGGIAKESYKEKAVAIGIMVKTHKLPLEEIKKELEQILSINVEVNGVEGVMASIGALTTKGTKLPIVVVDIGGGSTDVAILYESGEVKTVHLAGAGEMVTMLINNKLSIDDKDIAEEIKKNIVGKVESLYTLRLENGQLQFFENPIDSKLYGRVVIVKEDILIPIMKDITIEEVVSVRRDCKRKVFIKNITRGLEKIAPMGNLHLISSVVLVGGSALDFEISDMILKELANYGIASGCGNIRNREGPRQAVSTGLIFHYIERLKENN